MSLELFITLSCVPLLVTNPPLSIDGQSNAVVNLLSIKCRLRYCADKWEVTTLTRMIWLLVFLPERPRKIL